MKIEKKTFLNLNNLLQNKKKSVLFVIQKQSISAEVKVVQQATDETAKAQAAQQAIESIRRKQSARSAL